eukprot:scaffold27294_cov72-Cyclotella_meneghiniana.AAC.2
MHHQGCNNSLNVLATAENSQWMYCLWAYDVAELKDPHRSSHGHHHADELPIAMVLSGTATASVGGSLAGKQLLQIN